MATRAASEETQMPLGDAETGTTTPTAASTTATSTTTATITATATSFLTGSDNTTSNMLGASAGVCVGGSMCGGNHDASSCSTSIFGCHWVASCDGYCSGSSMCNGKGQSD